MKMNKFLSIVFLSLCFSYLSAEVEHSSASLMNRLEQLEGIEPGKYSQTQYNEIIEAISHLDEKIRVVSFNMLFDIYDSKLPEKNRWVARLPRIASLILEISPDIIGSQELYQHQVDDLLSLIGEDYSFYGEPMFSITTRQAKEVNGIFYRKSRFKEIQKKVLYLSETPDQISANPYDSSCRNAVILKLLDQKTGKIAAFINTHLSFSSSDSREFSARLIAKEAEALLSKMPVFFMGDLNTFPNRPDLKSLPFYDGDYIHRIFTSGSLKDSLDRSLLGHIGPIGTFTNEGEDPAPFRGFGTPGVFLDHIYVSPRVSVLLHAVENATIDGDFPSDHLPVIVDCLIH